MLALSGLPATSITVKTLAAWLPGRFRWQHTGVLRSPSLVVSSTKTRLWIKLHCGSCERKRESPMCTWSNFIPLEMLGEIREGV